MVSNKRTIFTTFLLPLFLFLLQINTIQAQVFCNRTIRIREKDIQNGIAPKFNLTNNLKSCWLKIETESPDYGIRVEFEHFHMQEKLCKKKLNGETVNDCCDYLEMGHGSVIGENIYERYCGTNKPETVMFDNSHVWFNIHTDGAIVGGGIKLNLKPFRVVFRELQGSIEANSLDQTTYLNNLDLTYKIVVPERHRLFFRFQNHFALEKFNDTCLDYVEIGTYKHETVDAKLMTTYEKLNTFCGQKLPEIFYIKSNQVYVRFVTDNNVTEAGFSLFYRAIKDYFTESSGNITHVSYPLDITYSIRAPQNMKIELTIEQFSFSNCNVKQTSDLAISPSLACSQSNDYLIFENTRESIHDSDFYNEMIKLPSESMSSSKWIFCACNIPVRTYISVSNELDIKYVSVEKLMIVKNDFKITYRFIPNVYDEPNQLRVIQDYELSFIDGYMLKIKVPINNHLRLWGKSTKCHFPKFSLISIKMKDKHSTQHVKQNLTQITPFVVKTDEFKKSCSYLFDIKEPRLELDKNNNIRHEASDLEWEMAWFIKFENSSQMYDFELNWNFFKNEIINEKHKTLFIYLPRQMGFESNKMNSDYLDFYFKTASKSRKYALSFEIDTQSGIESNEESKNVLILSKNEQNKPIQSVYLDNKQQSLVINSNEYLLKIKRDNKYGMRVNYVLDTQLGDCDFDSSFCNFTTSLILNTTLNPAKVIEPSRAVLMRHLPKYNSLDTDDSNVMDKATDFYLSVSESSTDNVSSIYSPIIDVQSKLPTNQLFNKKVYSLSFSYLMSNQSNDELEVFLINSRSDTKLPSIASIHRPISIFGVSSIRHSEKMVSLINLPKDCPSFSLASFLNTFVLTTTAQTPVSSLDRVLSTSSETDASKSLNNNQINESRFNWYRVNGLKLFSCYNFRFGFKFYLNKENKLQQNSNTLLESTIGLDDVELNQEGEVTDCTENICGSNGQCYSFNGESFCCCKPGYDGENCERRLNPCEIAASLDTDTVLCKNNGTCIENMVDFDYKCMCKPGFTGKNCEIEINECDSQPCMNHGKCLDLIDSYACVCKLGFSGRNCQKKDQDCKEKCSELGTAECFNDKSKTVCKCLPDFTGSDCSLRMKIDRCLSNPCVDDAECINDIDTPNGYRCLCPEYKSGINCEVTLDYCQDHKDLCKNGSHCLFANKDGTKIFCSCEAGFTGKFCDVPIDDCVSLPCENGAKCIDLHLSYKCECTNGYYGRNCEKKLSDPCYRNKCVKGKCVPNDFNNGYKCECDSNAYGDYCENDKCSLEKNRLCNPNGTLEVIPNQNGCFCVCKQGYFGEKCEKEVNLCGIRSKSISQEDECLNGGTCTYDFNEDRVQCACPEGFEGDRCEIEKNMCENNPCKYGKCINDGTKHKCVCTKGWQGEDCSEPVNYCSINDCVPENTAEYLNSITSCVCACKLGFTGERCQTDINDCVDENNEMRCKNGGKCIDMVGSYTCECPVSFTGINCERNVTAQATCASNPCKNGICEEAAGKTKCICDRGFTGDFCDEIVNKCNPNPCKNSGKCHNLIDDYYCECPPEFGSSKNCSERFVDPCTSSPCYNSGTCFPIKKRSETVKDEYVFTNFTCICPDYFKGDLCEIPNDPCSSNPCQHRGICTLVKNRNRASDNSKLAEYTCNCYPAYTGRHCESYLDQCKQSPCKNKGRCLATSEGPVCECPYNFGGKFCEEKLNPCEFMKCLNGGECHVDSQNVPYCKCPNNRFIGTRCEIDLTRKEVQERYMPPSSRLLANSEALTSHKCDILGNDVTTIDYIFAVLILFCILIFCIALIYIYVYFKVKKSKDYMNQMSREKEIFEELNNQDVSNKFNA